MPKVRPFSFGADDPGFGFTCPGCGLHHALPVGSGPVGRPRWTYNGNAESPTFSPSILARWTMAEPPVTGDNIDEWKRAPWPQTKVDHVCHSFVTDGRIQFLGDCTHALAGQTVDLPEIEAPK